jgi:hypothetical protein
MLLPLIPLGFEYVFAGNVNKSSLYIVTSMYAISLGVSSRSRLLFGSGIIVGFIFAALFGKAMGEKPPTSSDMAYPLITIFFVFLFHTFERYNRHVVERAPYWEFMTSGEDDQ